MSGIIRSKYRGSLDKCIGGAIMAFRRAQVEEPLYARNGVLAGLEMQMQCELLNPKFAARDWPTLKYRVGILIGVTTFDGN